MKSKLIIGLPSTKTNRQGLVWRSSWVSHYESPWGVLEKFKYANGASVREILELLGTEQVKALKTTNYSNRNRDLVHLSGLCNDECNKILGFPLKEENKKNISLIVGFLSRNLNVVDQYLREYVTFCPICIQDGFHCLFHQWKLIQICPYHLTPLTSHCPKCERQIPYKLSDNEMRSPFTCICGYSYIHEDTLYQFSNRWTNPTQRKIHLENLEKWLTLNDEQRAHLGSIHFHLDVANENLDSLLNRLLFVLGTAKNECVQHRVVTSAKYVENLPDMLDVEAKITSEATLHRVQFQKFVEEVYSSSYATLKSITRHFRKTIFMKHRTCIRRMVKLDKTGEICPYAYAYVAWQKNLYDFKNYWQVDRRYYPARWYKDRIEFASKQDMHYLDQLFYDLKNIDSVMQIPDAKVTTTKWVFNRIMSLLAINHLNNWLRIATKNVREGYLQWYAPHNYEDMPFYILQFNKNEHNLLKFYWWPETNPEKIELKCPFDTTRKKRNYRYETVICGETPMQAAMRKFDYSFSKNKSE
ncbi:TniQ family protein [Brevibacillus brevis]|uniref:TniQ family protein n=1 Tax=Brevibacillus brevis TaxID=1393 RepID=UPI0025A5203A|nr:TniQ family protein [Brevibacillus brevis]WJQ78968.1 TniQ family protein [Brevibacillus brevis]